MLLIKDIMNKNPVTIHYNSTLREAISLINASKVSDLMVLDDDNQFKGVVSEGDLIRYTLPSYDDIMLSSIHTREHAGDLFFESGRKNANESIIPLIIEYPIILHPNEQLFSAAIVMVSKQIRILPIVSRTHLMGTVSRSELCQAVLLKQQTSRKPMKKE